MNQDIRDPTGMSRREWLRSAAGAAAGLAIAPHATFGQGTRRPPNVILILADDLGSRDLGCYGASDLITPNIDALAARGVRFEQFYVTAPVCLASRASLLTGRHPQRVVTPDIGMSSSEVTLAELLRSAGYRTAVYGKWHLGHRADVSPLEQGFDHFVGFKFGAIDNYSHFYYWGEGARAALWRDADLRSEGGTYFPDIITDEAVDFIGVNRERPFFLYLPYNIPHYPIQPPGEAYRLYQDVRDKGRRFYGAFVTALDHRIGRVLKAVGENGLTRDTVILFLSDHGHSEEADSMGGGGSAGPFRGGKMTLWEGGIRVPCIAAWPGTLPQGRAVQQPVVSIDWLPTIADWCQVPLTGLEVDGRSLQPVLDSPLAAPPHESLVWIWEDWSAARSGPWKLVGDAEGRDHLYNLTADPGESADLLASEPATTRRLVALRDEFEAELRRDPSTHPWLPVR